MQRTSPARSIYLVLPKVVVCPTHCSILIYNSVISARTLIVISSASESCILRCARPSQHTPLCALFFDDVPVLALPPFRSMGLVFSSPNNTASDHDDTGTSSQPSAPSSSMSALANPETDPDVAASIVSKALLDTGEKLVRTMTAFMNPATVLDSFPDNPRAQLVYGIAPNASLTSTSSLSSSSACDPTALTNASTNPAQSHQQQSPQNHVFSIESDQGVDEIQPVRREHASANPDCPPLTDPVDVLMTRVAPKPLVRMLSSSSSSSNTPSPQPDRASNSPRPMSPDEIV